MFGFLVQWPTLLTLLMFPILVYMYVRLARREEREVEAEFGDEYRRYAARTPAFLPSGCSRGRRWAEVAAATEGSTTGGDPHNRGKEKR